MSVCVRVHAREYVGVYVCVCVYASVRERVGVQSIAENYRDCKFFMNFVDQIKAIHVNSQNLYIATRGHTCTCMDIPYSGKLWRGF